MNSDPVDTLPAESLHDSAPTRADTLMKAVDPRNVHDPVTPLGLSSYILLALFTLAVIRKWFIRK